MYKIRLLISASLVLAACASSTDGPMEEVRDEGPSTDTPVQRSPPPSDAHVDPDGTDPTVVPEPAPEPSTVPEPEPEPEPETETEPEPEPEHGVVNAVRTLDGGAESMCAVLWSGHVMCWGGAYGIDAVEISGIDTAIDIAAGVFHFCAVLADGTGRCWGPNQAGQLGDGSRDDSMTPVTVTGPTGIAQVSGAQSTSCAVTNDHRAYCWGGRWEVSPASVFGWDDVAQISVGDTSECALSTVGDVRCWGHNLSGQVGNGTTSDDAPPGTVLIDAVDVSAGNQYACAVLADGTAACWGRNSQGELGNGTTDNSAIPTTVIDEHGLPLTDLVAISASNGLHTCALSGDGDVACWGNGSIGQLGNGNTDAAQPYATWVKGVKGAVEVFTGIFHSCAVLDTGALLCWGSNARGELGNGDTGTWESAPSPVTTLHRGGA